MPEVEEDEPASASGATAAQQPSAPPTANIHRLEAETDVTGGLQVLPRAAAPADDPPGAVAPERESRNPPEPAPAVASSPAASTMQPAIAAPVAGPTPGVPVGKAPGGLQSRQDVAAQRRRSLGAASGAGTAANGSSGMSTVDAQAAVAASLTRLSNARKAAAAESPAEVSLCCLCEHVTPQGMRAVRSLFACVCRPRTGPNARFGSRQRVRKAMAGLR